MLALPRNTALLVIDVPASGAAGPPRSGRNNPGMETNIARLESAWRDSGRPALRVTHQARWPGAPIHYSAFLGTDLEGQLRRRGVATLVLAALGATPCVA